MSLIRLWVLASANIRHRIEVRDWSPSFDAASSFFDFIVWFDVFEKVST